VTVNAAVTVAVIATASKLTSLSRSQQQQNMTLVALLHQQQVQNLQPATSSQKNRKHLQEQDLQPHQDQRQSQTAVRPLQPHEMLLLQAPWALPLHPARRVQLRQQMVPLQLMLPQLRQPALQQQNILRRKRNRRKR
jgi:hypothetical protein